MLHALIIGLGHWGQHLVASIQDKSNKIRFTGTVLPRDETTIDFARKNGLYVYPDFRSALADSTVNAVIVATINSRHTEHVIEAIEAGKHVFVEKPVALTTASAKHMFDVCDRYDRTLAAGFNWRFHPGVHDLSRMLENRELGTLLHVEGNYSGPSGYRRDASHWRSSIAENPGGGMASRGIHIADLMVAMFGETERVSARSMRRVLSVEINDTTSALLLFQSGMTGYLATMMATTELWRLHVFGAKGWAELRFIEHLHRFELSLCLIDKPLVCRSYPPINTEHAELEAFADAVIAHVRYPVPSSEVLHGVRIFEAIASSSQNDGRWESTSDKDCNRI